MAEELYRKAIIVSRIYYENILKGYKVYVAGMGATNVFLNKIDYGFLQQFQFLNARLTPDGFEGTYAPLNIYPVIDTNNVIQKQGIVALACIIDKVTKKPLGAVIVNPVGNSFNVTYTNLKIMLQKYPAVNFKFDYDSNADEYITALDGSEFPVVEKTAPKSVTYNSINDGIQKPANVVTQATEKDMPVLVITDFDDVKNTDILARANATIVDVDSNLNIIAPYYFVMSRQIARKPTTAIDTMAVTEDAMFYNPSFMASLTVSEATFVMIHEMLHISMGHGIRFNPFTMIHKYWNIACDIYINAIICRDFGVKAHGSERKIEIKNKDTGATMEYGYIKCPNYGCFAEDFDLNIDFAKDTPESLYERLMEENNTKSNKNQQSALQTLQQSMQNQQGQQGGQNNQSSGNSSAAGQQGGQQGSQNSQSSGNSSSGASQGGASQGNNSSGQPSSNNSMTPELKNVLEGAKLIRECFAKGDFVHTADGMSKIRDAIISMRKKGMLNG